MPDPYHRFIQPVFHRGQRGALLVRDIERSRYYEVWRCWCPPGLAASPQTVRFAAPLSGSRAEQKPAQAR